MTDAVVWRTPGLIDLRSFTVVGFNAKPNTTNPIGFFGTGLKISIAVLDTSPWHDAARPWRLDGDTVVDAEGKELFTEPPFYKSQIPWRYLAEELVRVGNAFQQAPGPEESE